jgi:galactokinase
MTGGGFGGCTVSLVAPGADEALRAAVLRDAVSTVDGAGAIKSM